MNYLKAYDSKRWGRILTFLCNIKPLKRLEAYLNLTKPIFSVVWIPSANIYMMLITSIHINSIKRANTPANCIAAPENAPMYKTGLS
jgi:hypothetical protein